MYSTLMIRHWRMEGPTGGILMARPCQVSLRRAPTTSPHRVATMACFCFMVPLAMNVCVCVMKALGTTGREVELSNSAKTGITSPVEGYGCVNINGLFWFTWMSKCSCSHLVCSLCGQSLRWQTLVRNCGTIHEPSSLWFQPEAPASGIKNNIQNAFLL